MVNSSVRAADLTMASIKEHGKYLLITYNDERAVKGNLLALFFAIKHHTLSFINQLQTRET